MIDYDFARQLGNRHLHPEFDSKLGRPTDGDSGAVRITISPAMADTLAGQHIAWMLSNLLARQFAIVKRIEIYAPRSLPKSKAILYAPAASQPTLAGALVKTVSLIAGSAVDVVDVDSAQAEVDVDILIGVTEAPKCSRHVIGIYADGWNLYVGQPHMVPRLIPQYGTAFGPYFAACLGAGETFKRIRGMKSGAGSYVEKLFLSLWDFEKRDAWEALPYTDNMSVNIPAFYLVGAGAVGQAVVCTIVASDLQVGYLTLADHDEIDVEGTNLNRCALATVYDLGASKSELTAKFLQPDKVYAYQGKWECYVSDSNRVRPPADIAELERQLKFRLIVSCVDSNVARHAIQRCWPEYLMGGSTNGFGLEVPSYDMTSPYECLMCSNPLPKLESIEEIAEGFKKLRLDEQVAEAKRRNLQLELILEYLKSRSCGSAGENELRKFADWGTGPLPSVGFVSVGAGVILAAQLVKRVTNLTTAFSADGGNTVRFNFLNPTRFSRSKHLRREQCDCSKTGRVTFSRLWGD